VRKSAAGHKASGDVEVSIFAHLEGSSVYNKISLVAKAMARCGNEVDSHLIVLFSGLSSGDSIPVLDVSMKLPPPRALDEPASLRSLAAILALTVPMPLVIAVDAWRALELALHIEERVEK
jgi:hypothetical protein